MKKRYLIKGGQGVDPVNKINEVLDIAVSGGKIDKLGKGLNVKADETIDAKGKIVASVCVGALVLGRVKRLVFGAPDPKTGAFGSVFDVNKKKLNHKIAVTRGVLKEECAAVLKEFFKSNR